MLGKNVVDKELKRGLGLSIKEIEPSISTAITSMGVSSPTETNQ